MACETNLSKLHKVQNFFIRIAQHRVPYLQHKSNVDILNSLHLRNIDTRTKLNDLKFLYKIMQGTLRTNDLLPLFNLRVPRQNSRSQHHFYLSKPRLCLVQRSLVYRLSQFYNTLPLPPDFCSSKSKFLKACYMNLE